MPQASLVRIYTDGASRGNPGHAAYAYIIERDGQDPIEEADCLGKLTNNQAEYSALIEALKHAAELGEPAPVLVHSDSELMVRQMRGEYKVKSADLKPYYQEASRISSQFSSGVRYVHIPRSENQRADMLCNEALDGKRQATPRASNIARWNGSMAAAPVTAPSVKPGLREEAIDRLRQAAQAWSGGVLEPSPGRVWSQLTELLVRHGIAVPPQER